MADDADDQTSDRFLKVYLLWLFGWVLFCESAGDSVSRCMIPWAQRITDPPLATYRGLCSVLTRPTSREAILLGCPLLLQMWIHERFDIGRPRTDLSEYEAAADGTDPADLPTMGSLWCLRKVMTSLYVILRVMTSVVQFTQLFSFFSARLGWGQLKKAYKDFVGQIDRMVNAQVRCTSYAPTRAPQGLSSLCSRDQAYWMTRRRLVFDVYVEEYAVHRVMR
jgi:hypothetical protein